MKRSILTTAAFAAVILLVPAASATDCTWQYNGATWNGNWDDPNHWSCGYVPTANDTVELSTSSGSGPYIVTMNTAAGVCKTLTMHSDATLDVSAGDQLQIGNADGQFSTIDGTIWLSTSTSVLQFANSHTVTGGGSIDGQDDSALIKIATGKTLTNSMLIEGNCQIVPVGGDSTEFTNNGTVHANNAGTLDIAPDSIGVSSGVWQVSTSSSAVLKISTTSDGTHGGNANISNGTLDVDYSFSTVGDLSFTAGTIDVADGATLGFNQ